MNTRQSKTIWLETEDVAVGILPDVGGRIVHFGPDRETNILKSDPALWEEPDSMRPVPAADAGWKEYNGHIVWLGPQSEWWTRQDLNPERKAEKAMWPPDPWIIFGNYKVVEQTKNSIRMAGPHSPVSGVTLEKEIKLQKGSGLSFTVWAKNTSDNPVEWDLWLNTRLDAYDRVFVPVAAADDVAFYSEATALSDTINYEIENGYFSYLPTEIAGGKRQANSKAFITPSEPWMAAFTSGYCFVIRFDLYDPSLGHPEQAMVEIYNRQSVLEPEDLTEMEYHGPYERIAPGESMMVSSQWQLIPYTGADEDRSAFLDRKLKAVPGRE